VRIPGYGNTNKSERRMRIMMMKGILRRLQIQLMRRVDRSKKESEKRVMIKQSMNKMMIETKEDIKVIKHEPE